MARVFTREEFYELVWSKPLTHLAKEFALSDVALHKICKKHDIPNPPLGWWAKKAAGKAVKQIPLPPTRDGISSRVTIAAGELRPEPELIAAAREKARLLASTVDDGATTPTHPIVERTIVQLRKAKPSPTNGLVSIDGLNVVKAVVAPARHSSWQNRRDFHGCGEGVIRHPLANFRVPSWLAEQRRLHRQRPPCRVVAFTPRSNWQSRNPETWRQGPYGRDEGCLSRRSALRHERRWRAISALRGWSL